MTVNEFLEELKGLTGGKIIKEDGMGNITDVAKRPFSRLYADYDKHYIKVDFLDASEMLLEVNMAPPCRLLLRPENVVSKLLDKVNLSIEVKIGDAGFDAKYIVQNLSEEEAKKILNEKFKKTLDTLTPFLSFEMTNNEYKFIKRVDIKSAYKPQEALKDLQNLILLADITKGKV
jgi:hypothetical protein